jgi:hypothetical protein
MDVGQMAQVFYWGVSRSEGHEQDVCVSRSCFYVRDACAVTIG